MTHDTVNLGQLIATTVAVSSYAVDDWRSDKSLPLVDLFKGFQGLGKLGWLAPADEDGNGLSISDCWDEANGRITDGALTISRFQLDVDEKTYSIYALESEHERRLIIRDKDESWSEFLVDLEWGDLEYPEFLASFGLTDEAIEALNGVEDDCPDACRVWVSYCYYAGSLGRPQDGFLTLGNVADDGDQDPTKYVFENASEARKWIEVQEQGRYSLSNGEAGRPDYTICR